MKNTKKVVLFLKKIFLKNIIIKKNVDFWKTEFSEYNVIGENTLISYSEIGKMSYVGNNCVLNLVSIGNFCSIGSDVKVVYGNHPTDSYFSTHPSFYSNKKQSGKSFVTKTSFEENKKANKIHSVVIENDVWIGSNVTILEGVTIKTGAIIAAGSVVNKDVSNYEIVGGVPIKKIKNRFSDNIIVELLKTDWWSKDLEWFENQKNIRKIQAIVGEIDE